MLISLRHMLFKVVTSMFVTGMMLIGAHAAETADVADKELDKLGKTLFLAIAKKDGKAITDQVATPAEIQAIAAASSMEATDKTSFSQELVEHVAEVQTRLGDVTATIIADCQAKGLDMQQAKYVQTVPVLRDTAGITTTDHFDIRFTVPGRDELCVFRFDDAIRLGDGRWKLTDVPEPQVLSLSQVQAWDASGAQAEESIP